MFTNWLKIAGRNILRNVSYSLINIGGLAIGLASAIVIGLWVHQESSYDEHFADADRIYRVGVSFANIGEMAPGPEQFNEVAGKLPGVELTTSLEAEETVTITVGNREFEEDKVFYADSSFFDMFSYQFREGAPGFALKSPNTVVLTKEIAQKYFPGERAIGKTIAVDKKKKPYTVTGVVQIEGRSHIPADMFFYFEPEDDTNWLSARYYNYVLLRSGVPLNAFRESLQLLVKKTVFPTLRMNQSYEEWINSDAAYQFLPIPVTDIYLKSAFRFDMNAGGDETHVFIFGLISFFVVVIAGVNFINITTARSSRRSQEVGIRKTLGADRRSLVVQFLIESVVVSLIALIIALGLAEMFLSIFEQYTGIELLGTLLDNPQQLLVITLVAGLIGILAGLYPALYLASFRPVAVLKGGMSVSKNPVFRNILVVVQFTIAIGLLSCTGLVYQQLRFMQSRDMGLETKDILVIDNAGLIGDQAHAFKQQLLDQAGIVSASYNDRIPAGNSVLINTFRTPEMADGLPMQSFQGDYDFISTMGFQLLKGRNFSRDIASDTAGVILNQTAVRKLMLETPVGARLNENQKVIGVVSDFNFESLRKPIEPVAITLRSNKQRMAVRIKTADVSFLVSRIQDVWNSYSPAEPMNYYFLDQNYEALASREKALAKAILLFSVLSIAISCLGLYGLSAYICDLKTKEIGIRKVLGATVSDVVYYLTKDFAKPVLIAIVLAVPLAFAVMNAWLDNFAFKIQIRPWVFLVSCLAGLAVAWLTVSWQSVRTALRNPVQSLRSE